MITLTHFTTLESTTCCKCQGIFALTAQFIKHSKEVGRAQPHFCPYCGISQSWHDGEIDRLRKEKAALERQVEYQREQKESARREASYFRKSRDGMKGQLVRVRNRVQAGVCPCCNRTFANLARHMATKHPKEETK